jgi:predicted ester cyclase
LDNNVLEKNKAVVRRHFEEMWNRRELEVAAEITAPDMINHARALFDSDATPPSHKPYGIKGTEETVLWLTGMLPDIHYTIEQLIAEGDKVVAFVTVTGTHAPSGRPTRTQHVHIFQLRDGKTVDHWAVRDDLRVMQQTGAFPGLPPDSFITNE